MAAPLLRENHDLIQCACVRITDFLYVTCGTKKGEINLPIEINLKYFWASTFV